MIGKEIHDFAKSLWKFNRSITGQGLRQTLYAIKNLIPNLKIHQVPSGTKAFDWVIPQEWDVSEAYIITPAGKRICDYKDNNLHLLGYSRPIEKYISLDELQEHLYSDSTLLDAIPYVTSYYEKRWGFCLSQNKRDKLVDGMYKVVIKSTFKNGFLNFADILIPGKSKKEIFISTYICHPSMANDQLSGIVVSSYIASWLIKNVKTEYSYRFVFLPETIGSILYLSKKLKKLKSKVVAGYNISCIGDEREYSYLQSRKGNTLSDDVAKHILKWTDVNYKKYEWKDRASDERQYCSPGVDLPIATLCRSKFGEYPEYHTSHDNLENVVTPNGLEGGFNLIKNCILALENNKFIKANILCEPNLGRRGLYPTLSKKGSYTKIKNMMNILSYADGQTSLLDISEKCNVPIWELYSLIKVLKKENLIKTSFKKTYLNI